MLDLFLGDPVYDDQKNVIRRDFGVKNIVALMVVGFIGYSLMGEMKPISGKRKGGMKGGAGKDKGFWYNHGGKVIFVFLAIWIGGGLSMAGMGEEGSVTQIIGLIILGIGALGFLLGLAIS